ncbi:alcohol dehydrogenase catalytic domain-containing protein [Phytohabitans suffuscus]|uniref:IMP dehydrogenase n=1 Tax=Phytohabitans suffuscus TaxID=624315 RepID=A0A6F8YR04_9ACTN|nr:alcohol dehydrogenase catalytic domain-containing protein [Phytohabitans suffuscus]BCB88625.1 IMP dehydrogenase [Phytohabitans suffuscus]
MKAAVLHAPGQIRVVDAPDPMIQEPSDALVRVLLCCLCGSDLHPYRSRSTAPVGKWMGHEFVGVIEETGADVARLRRGDVVIAPFGWSDGTCDRCRDGLPSSCRRGGFWGASGAPGAQAEAVRVPLADGTLVKAPVTEHSALLPSLLTLCDVFGTGHHAAVKGGVGPDAVVTVVGDGAVGLLAVLSCRLLGASRIILMGRHRPRTALGVEFGATDVVVERGQEGIERVMDLTRGAGSRVVIEAVGSLPAYEQALGIVRPGGVISRVGLPQYDEAPVGLRMFVPNITLTGGTAQVRAYIEHLLPSVLDGVVDPGRVFDRTLALDDAAAAYRAMDTRASLKVLLKP